MTNPTKAEKESVIEDYKDSRGARLADLHYQETGHYIITEMKVKDECEKKDDYYRYRQIQYKCRDCEFVRFCESRTRLF